MKLEKREDFIEKALKKIPGRLARKISFNTPIGSLITSHREVYTKRGVRRVPVYSKIMVPEDYCARYVRLAAEEMFGFMYNPANAWDFAGANNFISNLENFKDLRNVEPGRVIGLKFLESEFNQPGRRYTHVGLFLGSNSSDILIAHKFHNETRVDSGRELEMLGLMPVEVIGPRG